MSSCFRRKIQSATYFPTLIQRSECISLAIRITGQFSTDGEMNMTANDMMAEIRDANLSYLMLAQQMIRSDKATAIFRLGLGQVIADLIEGMNNAQILKLAGSNMMLARFRFDDSAIFRPSARTFLFSETSNSRRRAPWALPPPIKIGARRSP